MKTTNYVAKLLGVTDRTVRMYCEKGMIPHLRLPSGHLRFSDEDIVRILEKLGGGNDKQCD